MGSVATIHHADRHGEQPTLLISLRLIQDNCAHSDIAYSKKCVSCHIKRASSSFLWHLTWVKTQGWKILEYCIYIVAKCVKIRGVQCWESTTKKDSTQTLICHIHRMHDVLHHFHWIIWPSDEFILKPSDKKQSRTWTNSIDVSALHISPTPWPHKAQAPNLRASRHSNPPGTRKKKEAKKGGEDPKGRLS